ncbi:hypothetical protein KAH81_10350, partial [bacterium]|nr:hypothetical protein [bacterium]
MKGEDNIQDKVINEFKKDIKSMSKGEEDWKTKVPRRAWMPIRDIFRIPSKIGSSSFDVAVSNGDKQREWTKI